MSNMNVGGVIPICGLLAANGAVLILMDIIGFGVFSSYYYYSNLAVIATAFGSGFWSGILLILAGGLGISGASTQRRGGDGKCAGVASMVFCILSAINTFPLLIYFIVITAAYAWYQQVGPYIIVHMILYLVAFPISIAGAAVVGRLACGSRATVVYTSGAPPVVVYGQPQQFGQQQQYVQQQQFVQQQHFVQQPQYAPQVQIKY